MEVIRVVSPLDVVEKRGGGGTPTFQGPNRSCYGSSSTASTTALHEELASTEEHHGNGKNASSLWATGPPSTPTSKVSVLQKLEELRGRSLITPNPLRLSPLGEKSCTTTLSFAPAAGDSSRINCAGGSSLNSEELVIQEDDGDEDFHNHHQQHLQHHHSNVVSYQQERQHPSVYVVPPTSYNNSSASPPPLYSPSVPTISQESGVVGYESESTRPVMVVPPTQFVGLPTTFHSATTSQLGHSATFDHEGKNIAPFTITTTSGSSSSGPAPEVTTVQASPTYPSAIASTTTTSTTIAPAIMINGAGERTNNYLQPPFPPMATSPLSAASSIGERRQSTGPRIGRLGTAMDSVEDIARFETSAPTMSRRNTSVSSSSHHHLNVVPAVSNPTPNFPTSPHFGRQESCTDLCSECRLKHNQAAASTIMTLQPLQGIQERTVVGSRKTTESCTSMEIKQKGGVVPSTKTLSSSSSSSSSTTTTNPSEIRLSSVATQHLYGVYTPATEKVPYDRYTSLRPVLEPMLRKGEPPARLDSAFSSFTSIRYHDHPKNNNTNSSTNSVILHKREKRVHRGCC